MAFNPTSFGLAHEKHKPSNFGKHFYNMRGQLFRKGLIYKAFSLKQLDAGDVRPSIEEREQFLNIYN
jgi:hypothetical protein